MAWAKYLYNIIFILIVLLLINSGMWANYAYVGASAIAAFILVAKTRSWAERSLYISFGVGFLNLLNELIYKYNFILKGSREGSSIGLLCISVAMVGLLISKLQKSENG
ncbi:MAG: hypothetical protein Q7N50_14065 [Armatimonadota bacterium]|nr:hypothetical protein [Armatimonadota bacterium]